MKRLIVLTTALLAALGARGALGQPVDYVQGPYGPGGTWNVYEFYTDAQTWVDANDLIEGLEFEGVEGHLVDIMSAEENSWVWNVGNGGDWWIGLTDREGAAPQVTNNGVLAPQESNTLADDTTMGWAWTSGQPFTYQNWNGGEPNDSGGEDAVHMNGSSVWNDHKSGWDIDSPITPTLQPDTSTDELTANQTFRYIVEYPVESATPVDGVDAPGSPNLCPVLPGVMGVDGQMGVTDFYGGLGTVGPLTNVCTLIEDIIDEAVVPDQVVDAQYRLSDVTDPDTNVAGGPVLNGLPLPFPSDVEGNDDNDFISIAKGTFSVEETGTYTIQVRSDDGMGLRVNGTEFTSVHGPGYKDENGAMVMALNTGDANTRGVIDLAAGEHSFEFMMWERGGGAYWEITKSEGANPNQAGATWAPLVDLDNVSPPTIPRDLPGVNGGDGTVGVTDYYGNLGTIDTLGETGVLLEQIKAEDVVPDVIADAQHEFTAARDPDTNADTWYLGAAAEPFPSDVPGNDDNDFISVAKGTVDVPESGTYTIQVQSDDGFGLRMVGKSFTSVHGGQPQDGDYVLIDTDGSMILTTPVGNSNSRGVIELTKGPQQFEFMFFERGGGARWEITSSSGAHPDAGTARWLLIGDDTVLDGVDRSGPGVATMVGDALVVQNLDSLDSGAGNPYIEDAIVEVQDALADLANNPNRNDVSTVLIYDAGSPARPSGAVQGEKYRFPSNEGDDTDFNNFSAGVFGKLMVDDGDQTPGETIQVTFGMFTDDHSLFHVVGESFSEVGGSADTQLLNIEGDETLSYDLPTGNSNSLGLIELTEGVEYDFEGYMHENAGGANYEIWAAPGDQLDIDLGDQVAFLSVFNPLSNASPDISLSGNMGLELIEMPDVPTGDYNQNGQLDAGDLDLQADAMVGGQHPKEFDLNDDDLVNYADREVWVNDLKNTWIGDANLDLEFNSGDMVQVFSRGKYETGEDAGWEDGDWNGDKEFGSGDMVAAFVAGGYELGAKPSVSAVPEPSSILLILIGLIGLVGLARRRQK